MREGFSILVADKNRHIRELLRRELEDEGYIVLIARDGREVLDILGADDPPALLVLDMEIPFVSGVTILQQVSSLPKPPPVVLHTFLTESMNESTLISAAAFVEKSGDTSRLKCAIDSVLLKSYPDRYFEWRRKFPAGPAQPTLV